VDGISMPFCNALGGLVCGVRCWEEEVVVVVWQGIMGVRGRERRAQI